MLLMKKRRGFSDGDKARRHSPWIGRKLCVVVFVLLLLAFGLYWLREVSRGPCPSERATWHANRIAAGEWDCREDLPGRPHHVVRLVELGPSAGPALLPLLKDQRLTGHMYYGHTLIFSSRGYTVTDPRERQATVSDLADYALRSIYFCDAGFRSYRSEKQRAKAIAKWESIVSAGVVPGAAPGADPEIYGHEP